MIRYIFPMIILLFTLLLLPQEMDVDFHRGLVSFLSGEIEQAKTQFSQYFSRNYEPQLRQGYIFLTEGKSWEATTRFKDYLEINHRSEVGLIGISLATAGLAESTSKETLNRAIRLHPRSAAAYLVMGYEYLKTKNYPRAEEYYRRAIALSPAAEYKILLATLYLQTERYTDVLNLLQGDREPENLHFNLHTAQALIALGRAPEAEPYVAAVVQSEPQRTDVKLLRARYLAGTGEYKDAKTILQEIDQSEFSAEASKLLARVLVELNDRQASKYLYQYFSRNRWDTDINVLMARFFLLNDRKQSLQYWITRSILAGADTDGMKELFPSDYNFQSYPSLNFFEVTRIQWIPGNLWVAVARIQSGEPQRLYFIRSEDETPTIVQSFDFSGKFQDMYMSDDGRHLVVSTEGGSGRVRLYAVAINDSAIRMTPMFKNPLPLERALAGFDTTGNLAYITDKRIARLAFESPFSIVSLYGDKDLVYPSYPFHIYKHDFTTGRFVRLGNTHQSSILAGIPIPAVKKYALVNQAFQANPDISQLIKKGTNMDLTSSDLVRIHVARDLSAFVMYLSDLENSFQAKVYYDFQNRLESFNETMILGKDEYSQLEIIRFDPATASLLLLTKDKKRRLFHFNYRSRLSLLLAENVLDLCYGAGTLHILTEKKNNIYYSETNLALVSLDPPHRSWIDTGGNLAEIVSCRDPLKSFFYTYDGQLAVMDRVEDNRISIAGIAFRGTPHYVAGDRSTVAVFINGRFYVLDWILPW